MPTLPSAHPTGLQAPGSVDPLPPWRDAFSGVGIVVPSLSTSAWIHADMIPWCSLTPNKPSRASLVRLTLIVAQCLITCVGRHTDVVIWSGLSPHVTLNTRVRTIFLRHCRRQRSDYSKQRQCEETVANNIMFHKLFSLDKMYSSELLTLQSIQRKRMLPFCVGFCGEAESPENPTRPERIMMKFQELSLESIPQLTAYTRYEPFCI